MIPDDLVFDLFVALDALFHQHLPKGGEFQRVFHQRQERVSVIGKAAARSAERKRGAQHNGVPDLFRNFQPFFYGMRRFGRERRFPQIFAKLFELFPIFGLLNGMAVCSKQFYMTFGQNAFLFQLHGKVQPRLTTDAGKDRVRPLISDDLGNVFER